MDLNQIVMDSFKKIQESGYVEQVVEKKLKETLASVIDDTFRSYSDFGKALKTHVQEQLNVDLKQLDLKQYNELVLDTVKRMLDESIRVNGVEAMKERLDEMFGDVPDEIKLSELVEKLKEYAIEYGDFEKNGNEITLDVDDPRGILTFISLDARPDIAKYSCRYRFHIDQEGRIGSAKIDGSEFNAKATMAGYSGFDAFLFKLFAHKTKLVLDIDDVNTYFENDEDYD